MTTTTSAQRAGDGAATPPGLRVGGLSCGGRPGNPITFRGKEYPSQRALAHALGLNPSTVSLAIKAGRLHSLGTGRGVSRAASQPCAAYGFWWASQAECATDLGVHNTTVSYRLRVGTFDELVRRRKRLSAAAASPSRGEPSGGGFAVDTPAPMPGNRSRDGFAAKVKGPNGRVTMAASHSPGALTECATSDDRAGADT